MYSHNNNANFQSVKALWAHKTVQVGTIAVLLGLSGCKSVPMAYNGTTGYQVIQVSQDQAQLRYTLAARSNNALDQNKLQAACQKVLNGSKSYQLEILTVQEIAYPQGSTENFGIELPKTQAKFALSNTQGQYNTDNSGMQQALDSKPSTLNIVDYRCK